MKTFDKVVLEINSDCNRKCRFCNRHGDEKNRFFDAEGGRVKAFMPMFQIRNILEQLEDMNWKGEVAFGHMSEPTLDDRLCEVITMFKDRGFSTFLHTNGDILSKDEELCDALSPVCDIIRVGIYDLDDEDSIDARKRWWAARLFPTNQLIYSVSTVRFQRRFSLDDGNHVSYPNGYCTEPTRCLVIYYDGEVALCCEDINCSFGLGNTFETPIQDIWGSEHHEQIAQKLRERRSHYPVCASCPIEVR